MFAEGKAVAKVQEQEQTPKQQQIMKIYNEEQII